MLQDVPMETTRRMMWKWFVLSLATLTFSTVVSATGVLFVKPTNDTSCPQQPCHTLEHYAQSWQLYLTSNTVVQFLPGEHVLEGNWSWLKVENVSNVTLIGSDSAIPDSSFLGIPMATSIINCRGGKTMFYFYNVTRLLVIKLIFTKCGGRESTLYLYEVSNLMLDSVAIQNSTGTGLLGFNLRKSLIHRSSFMFNEATRGYPWSGNIMLLYNCSEMIETFTLNITSSWILFGNGTTELGCVGGLGLQFSQSCYNAKVNIHNTTLMGNVGGNMLLVVYGFAHNSITIADSHFENGYSSKFGGGILLITRYNPPQFFHNVQSNLVYINNTQFVANGAESGGAVFLIPCRGTELHINGSKFRNNVAHLHGGHIAIDLFSTPQTCANSTIKISSSLLEGGKSKNGNGGGVAALGASDDSQYSNGHYIYISNTQFVGNHAEYDGGAVALWGGVGGELHIDESEFTTIQHHHLVATLHCQ